MKICFCIIYNHNFEQNIKVLDKIYAERFSNIWHIMPFYRGNAENVISVYENSYQFNGYIPQASRKFMEKEASYYVFVADDMVLNPIIDERNIVEKLKLDFESGFISGYKIFTNKELFYWPNGRDGAMYLNGISNSCEWRKHMPNLETARKKFEEHGINWRNGATTKLYKLLRSGLIARRNSPYSHLLLPPLGILHRFSRLFINDGNKLNIDTDKLIYPTVWGYSDFFCLSHKAMLDFCHYCGVFAAARQFVEVAIPTAMVFSCKKINTLYSTGWKAENGVNDYSVRIRLETMSDCSYSKLIDNFPADYLYIHPVKLSKWKDLP